MRRYLSLLAAALVVLGAATAVPAETTRTLKIEYTPSGTERFKVENLAGVMRIVPGGGDRVIATATVHAEDDRIASMVRFDEVRGEGGGVVLRVRYPVDDYSTFRYPGRGSGSSFLGLFGGSSTTVEYDDRRVKVSASSGVLLYADVEVQLPRREVSGTFRNVVGTVRGENVEGNLTFDTGSGDVILEGLRGRIGADTGSGDVTASSIEGAFSGDTGSGDITLSDFDGEEIECDTGSGDVKVTRSTVRTVKADTGSGNVSVEASDIEEFVGDTGSGSIRLEASGSRLARVRADTGSGDVELRLDDGVSFEVIADQGSGEIYNRFADAQPIVEGREVIGYRRGDGRTRIRVDTGSGDVTVAPLR